MRGIQTPHGAHDFAHLAQAGSQRDRPTGAACQLQATLQPFQRGIVVVQYFVGIARVDGHHHGGQQLPGLAGRVKGAVKLHQGTGKAAGVVVARCKVGVDTGRHAGMQPAQIVSKTLAPQRVAVPHIAQHRITRLVGFEVIQPMLVLAELRAVHGSGQTGFTLRQIAGAGMHRCQYAVRIGAARMVSTLREYGKCGLGRVGGVVKVGQQPVGLGIDQIQPRQQRAQGRRWQGLVCAWQRGMGV